ncbi:MAG: hypothetical protein KGY42_02975 [Desulfobacterales bacterium]|nr:hypothetical protein [Desulfobacterales bacterium]MBS3755803.1 hypothetical protein [Desulfobacterales bacterium]
MEKNDPRIRERLAERAPDGELPCAVAFALAEELETSPATIGAWADELQIRLVKCQLGLFGYAPEKKIVKPRESVPDELRRAIAERLENGRLPCRAAFAAAELLGIRKMDVSGACETLDVKIKPCQLGAF